MLVAQLSLTVDDSPTSLTIRRRHYFPQHSAARVELGVYD
jgi:hypothetical protein